ncbi:Vegetative incompatibility protein HET-E-1 [Ceratobasidium theobromae]|uniref:Vegetative incompatibility protein HET-E-1 n=1 Tax=Ceratobasidium theobromae TaxID=1582974 RepID=A0A5N5Q7M0_9AGAM|nr:Vegetative incompatibility protein HET-E-1 [Ceratobasidium theobromae]
MVIVIDALDECDNKDSTRQILDVLLSNVSNLPVKFLVSSRPESEIRDQMMSPAKQIDSRIVLHELDKGQVQLDIATYLETALVPMNPRPSKMEIAELVRRAGVLFIYAATAVQYIGYDNFHQNAPARLQTVLSASSSGKTNKNKEINELYTTILRAALDDPGLDKTEQEDMKTVLHMVICAQEPLTTRAISGLLRMGDNYRVDVALRPLWSVLHIVGTSDVVTTLHASFPDYMFDLTRSKEYYCDPTIHNSAIALLCFDLIKHTQLQFNICGLESSYVMDEDVLNLEQRINDAWVA